MNIAPDINNHLRSIDLFKSLIIQLPYKYDGSHGQDSHHGHGGQSGHVGHGEHGGHGDHRGQDRTGQDGTE